MQKGFESFDPIYKGLLFLFKTQKKKKTQESVERVMDGNSMRLVIVMIMMMGFVMLALGVSLFFSKPLIKSKVFTLTKLIPR